MSLAAVTVYLLHFISAHTMYNY